jgi:hypothetical protein
VEKRSWFFHGFHSAAVSIVKVATFLAKALVLS